MHLNIHLQAKGLTDQQFADIIGCDRSFVTRLRNGDASASFQMMQKIEEATGGAVTAVDIYEARKDRLSSAKPLRKPKAKPRGRRYHHAAE